METRNLRKFFWALLLVSCMLHCLVNFVPTSKTCNCYDNAIDCCWLLLCMIGPLVDTEDPYYTFLIELIQIVQLIFSPVIKTNSIQYLKQLITDHLSKFKELFLNANVLPKQHYLIHIPSTITMLGPSMVPGTYTLLIYCITTC